MEWKGIKTKEDIENLMETFGCFHDSCLSKIEYNSNAFVNENLYMNAMDDNGVLYIKFQRQANNPREIELEFRELIRLNLIPYGKNNTCEIHSITFFIKNKDFYWGDCGEITDFFNYKGTWLQAKQVRWRSII